MGLSNYSLEELRERGFKVPSYDRSEVTAGVVHIGPSHFARGHVFNYFNRILDHDLSWGVRAISLKTSDARDALTKQDYLYTVTERVANERRQRVIGSLMDITVAPEDPQGALEVLCDPKIKLVTLTVTQKGYYYNPDSKDLDFDSDDVQDCLANMDSPSTAIGYLVAALEKRMESGAPPLTIMSCDNMPANGTITKQVVLSYAARRSKELRQYVEENIKFPSTMVDRIVPRTKKDDIFNSAAQRIRDNWPIMTERFRQWAIEDNFAGPMPNFEQVGATIVKDVEPFELMKLRMVNGAHMALGCIGRLAGYDFVDKAMEDPAILSFIKNFIAEAEATVPDVEGVDFTVYKNWLIERFENPHMDDELSRLARNGTDGKVKPRILSPLKDAIAHGQYQYLAFAAASWIQYLKGYDDAEREIDIVDEKAIEDGLQKIARNSNGNPEPVMTASGLFDRDLMKNSAFISDISRHLHNIQEHGALDAISMIGAEEPTLSRQMAAQIPS